MNSVLIAIAVIVVLIGLYVFFKNSQPAPDFATPPERPSKSKSGPAKTRDVTPADAPKKSKKKEPWVVKPLYLDEKGAVAICPGDDGVRFTTIEYKDVAKSMGFKLSAKKGDEFVDKLTPYIQDLADKGLTHCELLDIPFEVIMDALGYKHNPVKLRGYEKFLAARLEECQKW